LSSDPDVAEGTDEEGRDRVGNADQPAIWTDVRGTANHDGVALDSNERAIAVIDGLTVQLALEKGEKLLPGSESPDFLWCGKDDLSLGCIGDEEPKTSMEYRRQAELRRWSDSKALAIRNNDARGRRSGAIVGVPSSEMQRDSLDCQRAPSLAAVVAAQELVGQTPEDVFRIGRV
jgi:hypothetical protein